MPARQDSFRADINGLRAIAMLMVLLFHFHMPGVAGGFIGVDIFFVISGFLMTSLIIGAGAGFSIMAFYSARALRIMPALIALLTTLLVLGFFFLEPGSYRELAAQAGAAAVFLSNFAFLAEIRYFHPAAETHWLLHTWTLSVEWQFYLLYPLFMLGARFLRLAGNDWLVAVFAVSFLASLVIAITLANLQGRFSDAGFYLLPSRAFEMLAGSLTFFLARSETGKWLAQRKAWLQAAGLALCLASAALVNAYTPWPSFYALVPVLGTCLTILAGCGDGGLLKSLVFQRLGSWSYSIYLWHWPVAVLLREAGHDVDLGPAIGGMAASILLGALSFHWIERPARQFNSAEQRGWAVAVLAGFSALLLIASSGIHAAKGLPERAERDQALLADAMSASREAPHMKDCNALAGDHLRSCPMHLPAEGRVAIVGDSHAIAWFPRYGEPAGGRVEFFLHYGCPPFPTYADRTQNSCARFNRLVLDRIVSGPYDRVVFISLWVQYLEAHGTKACRITDDGCQPLGNEVEEDRLFADFYAAVEQLVQAGREVIVVQPIPAPYFDVPKAVRAQAFSGRSNPALSGIDLAARDPAEDRVRAKLKRAEAHGAIVVDPRAAMCRDGVCPVLAEDGRPLYADGNHLRPWVIRERLDFLDPYINGDPPSVATIRAAPTKAPAE